MKPRGRFGGIGAAAAAVIVSFASERIFLHGAHHEHWWDTVPVFYALFGFVGGILLSSGAKLLAKRFIQRKEGYYDGD